MVEFSNAHWMPIIPLAASYYFAMLVHVGTMAFTGALFGARILEITIGQIVPLASLPLPSFRLTLKAVPIGGFVKFADREETAIPIGQQPDQGAYFDTLPISARITTILSGCIVLFAIAYALLGESTWRTGFSIWEQYFLGALSPFDLAQGYLAECWAFAATAPTDMLLGTVSAKVAAINLLPLAFANGGMVLILLLGASQSGTAFEAYAFVSVLLLILPALSWIVAIGYAVL